MARLGSTTSVAFGGSPGRRPSSLPRSGVLLASACFVLSGAAALVYQVAWQRLLALSSGVAVHAVAAIIAAFMAGLGLGSYAGGLWSRRLNRRQAILGFAGLEFGLAAFALISVPLYYDLLYLQMPWFYETPALSFLTHFVSLLVPTTLMGISLPLLVRGLILTTAEAPRTIGFLYGANTLGAAVGAFLTPWVLLRFLGVDGALHVGAGLSALAAAGAIILANTSETLPARTKDPELLANPSETLPARTKDPELVAVAPSPSLAERIFPLSWWVALYAVSGFVSLSLEVVWFRVLDVAVKGAAFTFGTLLGIYLLGLAGGAFVGSVRAPRILRPLRAFVACQGILLAATLLAHLLLVRLPPTFPVISWIIQYGTGSHGVRMQPFDLGAFSVMYVALPLALFGPATFLMGFGFPVLQRAVHRDVETSGRTVGFLQAANIAGCTLGSLTTGLLLIDWVGSSGTFRILALIGAAVATAGGRLAKERRLYLLGAGLVVLAAIFPQNDELWLRLMGNPSRDASFVEEDAAGVTVLTPGSPSGYRMWINGRANSWLPFGGIHTALGAIPALLHPSPRDVAIIGLASADTAWAASFRQETETVTVFEIAGSETRLLARVQEDPLLSALKTFLADPRLRIVRDDGRRRLARDGIQYDIIEADAIFPDSGMSGNLYSVEFYELVSRSLKPGGMMFGWTPTPRARASARAAFAHVVDFGGLLLLSNEEIAIDPDLWRDRLWSRRTSGYFGRARLLEISSILQKGLRLPPAVPGADLNRNLQPKDEFSRPPGW